MPGTSSQEASDATGDLLWQMDVTHVSSFGKLSFVHVTVDTFSHVIIATARTGEVVKDVISLL